MAVHFSIGRFLSIFLFALLAVAAGTAHYLSRSGPEAETTSASQITVAVPSPAVPAERRPDAEPVAAVPRALAVPTDAVPLAPMPVETMPADTMPSNTMPSGAEVEPEVAPEPKFDVEAEPEAKAEAEVVIAAAAELEAVPAADAVQTAPVPVAAPSVAPSVAPSAAPSVAIGPAAPRQPVTIARLVTEPQRSPGVRDPARSTLRPKNLAPIPKRAPRAAKAGSIAARSAATLFKNGTEIKIKRDANVYITAPNIPKNDRLLEAYNADRPNRGRVQTRLGEATAVPGLLGIANQAHRAQDPDGRNAQAYSLADAMRDAIWRKNTAARLKSLTAAQNACAKDAGGTSARTHSFGLATGC